MHAPQTSFRLFTLFFIQLNFGPISRKTFTRNRGRKRTKCYMQMKWKFKYWFLTQWKNPFHFLTSLTRKRNSAKGQFYFLTSLKHNKNYAQNGVSWFSKLETKKKVCSKWVPLTSVFPTWCPGVCSFPGIIFKQINSNII